MGDHALVPVLETETTAAEVEAHSLYLVDRQGIASDTAVSNAAEMSCMWPMGKSTSLTVTMAGKAPARSKAWRRDTRLTIT